MHANADSKKQSAITGLTVLGTHWIFIGLALAYGLGASVAAWKVTAQTKASTDAIEHMLVIYSMKNEGEQTLHTFEKQHPILSMFAGSAIKNTLKLPSHEKSSEALYGQVPHLLKTIRIQSSKAAWWSWGLICLSLFYYVTVVACARRFVTRPVLFAMTLVSVVFFIIGVVAPAMVIWTAPNIPLATGDLNFVVQHQVRGIAAIIWELLTQGHGIIGGFLLLFSIMTPLTKASLTFVATASHNMRLNHRIGQILHTIGKWSMADVFVAAILLSLYALKFQQATKSIPCLGLYYFIGYCFLSLTTTQLLVISGIADDETKEESKNKAARNPLALPIIAAMLLGLACFTVGSGFYTYQQYTVNTREEMKREASAPSKLDARDLVLPGHRI